MALTPQFDQLVIDNGSNNFKESFFFEPDLFTEQEYGRLLLSVEVADAPDGSKKLANLLKKTLKTNFYNDLSNDPYVALESTLQVINEEVAKLAKELGDWVWQVSAVAAIFTGEELHISVSGQAEVYIVRGKQIINVAEGLAEGNNQAEQKLFFSIASGQLDADDVCLLSTGRLDRFIKPKKIAVLVEEVIAGGAQGNREIIGSVMRKLELADKQLLNLALLRMGTEKQLAAQMSAKTTGLAKLQQKGGTWLKALLGRFMLKSQAPEELAQGSLKEKRRLGESLASFKRRLAKTLHIIKSKRLLKETAQSLVRSLPQQKRQRRALIATAVICLLILLGAIGVINKSKRASDEKLATIFEEIIADRQAAETRRLFDKEGAKRLLSNAAKLATELEEADYRPLDVASESAKINLMFDDLADISRVRSANVYNDLKKEVSKPAPRGMFYQDNNLFVYDHKQLYKVLLDKIEIYPLLTTNEEIIAASSFQYNKSFLFLTSAGKLYEFKNNTLKEVAHAADGPWPAAQAIAEYSESRNIYLLDAAGNEIWAYRATADGFSKPSRKNTVKSDLKESIDLAVDGNLYVLKSNGDVIKTYSGSPRDFALKNLPEGLGEVTQILTTVDQDQVYFLFPQKRSIVKTDKRGTYIKQYLIEDPNFAVPIAYQVNEALAKIFVLDSGGKIIEIQI